MRPARHYAEVHPPTEARFPRACAACGVTIAARGVVCHFAERERKGSLSVGYGKWVATGAPIIKVCARCGDRIRRASPGAPLVPPREERRPRA